MNDATQAFKSCCYCKCEIPEHGGNYVAVDKGFICKECFPKSEEAFRPERINWSKLNQDMKVWRGLNERAVLVEMPRDPERVVTLEIPTVPERDGS